MLALTNYVPEAKKSVIHERSENRDSTGEHQNNSHWHQEYFREGSHSQNSS